MGGWWQARRIEPADLRHDGNSFTIQRWVLASSVMISHAWDLTSPVTGLDPIASILGFPVSRLAVYLFFTLSGFLVTGSLYKRGVTPFLMARALRLLPGLWVMLIVVPLGLWAAFGTLSFGAFVGSPETWRFVARNALLLGRDFTLPGLFETHYLPGVVNGSLWTIPKEVQCYLALTLAAALGLTQPRRRMTIILVLLLVLELVLPTSLRLGSMPLGATRQLAFAFGLGVLAWLWRERLPLSWPLALGLVALALLVPAEARWKINVSQVAFGYLAIVAGFRVPAAVKQFSAAAPDYSYGIYIYAFPMQQAAVALGATTPLANLGLAFAMAVPLAALSWHLVEKPALRLKPGVRPAAPVTAGLAGPENAPLPASRFDP